MNGRRKATSVEVEHDTLVAVAEELNDLMFEEGQGIKISTDDKKLAAGIIEAAKELTPEDKISDETKEVLTSLSCLKSDKKSEKVDEPEEKKEEEEKEEPKVDLETLVIKTRKLSVLKEIVQKNDEFKKLQKNLDSYAGLHSESKLKADMAKILGVDLKIAKSVAKKREAGSKFTRYNSVTTVLYESAGSSMSKDDIIKAADELYAKKSGKKSNIEVTEWHFNQACAVLTHLNFLSRDKDGNVVISKAVASKA